VQFDRDPRLLVVARYETLSAPAGRPDFEPRPLRGMRDLIQQDITIELTLTNEWGKPERQVVPFSRGAARGSDLCINFSPERVIHIMEAPTATDAPRPRTLGLLDRVYTKKEAMTGLSEAVSNGAVLDDPTGHARREIERVDRVIDKIDELLALVAPPASA
jgi:hypothetical protein